MAKRQKLNNGEADFKYDHLAFDYSAPSRVQKPQFLNTEIVKVEPNQKLEPTSPNCSQLDFDVGSERTILCGPATRFEIKFHIERKKPDVQGAPGDPAVAQPWATIPPDEAAAEAAIVRMQPGWIDSVIKSIDIYYNTTKISTSNENKFIASHLNRFVDAIQDKKVMALFSPQQAHPYRLCSDLKLNSVDYDDKNWTDYAPHVFHESSNRIDFWPRHWFFMNGPNFFTDQGAPRALPMPLLGGSKLNIRLTFADDWSSIFRIRANNRNKYRLHISHFRLLVQEARLHLPLEKSLFSSKRTFHFPGVTRAIQFATVPATSTTFNVRFNDVTIPEGILIYCASKRIPNGSYSFATDTSKNVFLDHAIRTVDVSFNNARFAIRDPHIGNLGDDVFDHQRLLNLIYNTPFGLKPDLKALKLDYVQEGGRVASSFPHVFVPLTHFGSGKESRLVPVHDDGTAVTKRGALDVFLKFIDAGATADVVYIFVIYYTDSNLAFDAKNKQWFNSHVPMY